MFLKGNLYYSHPQPAASQAADDLFSHIAANAAWDALFGQGKMVGVLVVKAPSGATPAAAASSDCHITYAHIDDTRESNARSRVHIINNVYYLAAYSGVINGLVDTDGYFVPSIYDLQNPDDFYLQRDAEISNLNREIAQTETLPHDDATTARLSRLRAERRSMSIALQKEIFSHFSIINYRSQYRNVVDIFADARRGLPPGGTGECAAPRLLQYAYEHGLEPIELAEYWYGMSPRHILRVHHHSYPSCIEKCSPLLAYMLPDQPLPEVPASDAAQLQVIYEDDSIMAINKPAGLLSAPAKDLSLPNVETMLHQRCREVRGPMLVHRLDQATSGILLAAKDAVTHKRLQQQFEQREVHKQYVAEVWGRVESRCGVISLPLTVNPDDRPRQVVDHQFGKEAVTYYEVVRYTERGTVLHLWPQTGRTHQLRVHCASPFGLDHPIIGDLLYDIMDAAHSIAPTDRLMLHAAAITFRHPVTDVEMCLTAPL